MSTSYFTDESMLRRVIRETVVAFSAPRTLLMQAAHPVAFAGFFAHTGSLDDPYARLRRTAEVLDLVAWGSREEALHLVEADLAAADDEAPPAPQPQAGDVERGVEHVPHAGLIADPATELADALLTGVGLCWHRP